MPHFFVVSFVLALFLASYIRLIRGKRYTEKAIHCVKTSHRYRMAQGMFNTTHVIKERPKHPVEGRPRTMTMDSSLSKPVMDSSKEPKPRSTSFSNPLHQAVVFIQRKLSRTDDEEKQHIISSWESGSPDVFRLHCNKFTLFDITCSEAPSIVKAKQWMRVNSQGISRYHRGYAKCWHLSDFPDLLVVQQTLPWCHK